MEKQKNNSKLVVIIVILSILILAFAGYFIYSKIITAENNTISKTDETKDWVYDALYDYDFVTAESYSTQFGETYYVKDVIVPYINIESSDAQRANNEIKAVFDSAVSTFNEGMIDGFSYVDQCNYVKYVNENVLSVDLSLGIGATNVVTPTHYTYNFDLETGKLLSYEEVYNLAGFESDDITTRVKKSITDAIAVKLKETNADIKEYIIYNSQSYNNYKNSVTDNSVQYFLDENKKLNIIVTLSIPEGSGQFETLITVE